MIRKFRTPAPARDSDNDYIRQVTKNAIRMQSVMFIIQPLVITLVSLASLWVIGVGIWHLTGWEHTPEAGQRWLTGDRRVISAGLASLAALSITARAVLTRIGQRPAQSTLAGEQDTSSALKAELDEQFDGLSQRLVEIERRESHLDATQRDFTVEVMDRLTSIESQLAAQQPSDPAHSSTVRRQLTVKERTAVEQVQRQLQDRARRAADFADRTKAEAFLARLELILGSSDKQALFEVLAEIGNE